MDKIVMSAIIATFAFTTSHAIAAEVAAKQSATDQQGEKCYGIVKAGNNDCATATNSCAGSATKDQQSDAFILLPKGVCEKIVGGSLKSKPETKK